MGRVAILGIFAADTAYRATRLPRMGETILGEGFKLSAGGKGSNQAVAVARSGAAAQFLTRIGEDAFGDMAMSTWQDAGIDTSGVIRDPESYTGAAFIYVDAETGDNAIIVAPGAAGEISEADVEGWAGAIGGSDVFITQLEHPIGAAVKALSVAREAGVTTILNPAPAADLPEGMLALCDWVTPNESEAEHLTGLTVGSPEEARKAAEVLVEKGAGGAIITLGPIGAYLHGQGFSEVVPAAKVETVVETTGAGDTFNGAFAAALAGGAALPEAVRFGTAAASISVTRRGAAESVPTEDEVRALMQGG